MEDKFYILSTDMLSPYKPKQREKKNLSCFKLDYMIRLFHSIRNKPFESYVIQRIWHRLDDERVFFVTQQYFLRSNSSYALVDLYLPQLNLVIEVDEGYHSKLEQQKRDTIRSQEIRSITDAEIIRITLCKEVDGERTLLRYEQHLSRLTEKGHTLNFYKNFSHDHIDEANERKMRLWNFSGLDVPRSVHPSDEEWNG